jgi:tRNA pseudouridine55 synthase
VTSLDGILCVDKPAGWTSHDVVAKVRRISGQRKIGHTGTLDPAATGLLVLCLGLATRLVEYMTAHDKAYRGIIQLGVSTTTDDAEGEVVRTESVPEITGDVLRNLERRFSGELDQRPPAYSAVGVGGRRAYALARAGAPPVLPARRVVVHQLALERLPNDRLAIAVECGPGTYIRSLARDIGDAIGCGAHLASLRRERAGRLMLEDALTLEEVEAAAAESVLSRHILSPDEGLLDERALIISEQHGRALAQGQRLSCGPAATIARARIYDTGGAFIGVGAVESGRIRPLKVLKKAEFNSYVAL